MARRRVPGVRRKPRRLGLTLTIVSTLAAVVVATTAVLALRHHDSTASAQCPESESTAIPAAFRHSAPTGQGPWPFDVAGTGCVGLWVRNTDTATAKRLGGLAPGQRAWVVCGQHSGFDPEGNGDLWYRVKWSQTTPSTHFLTSDFAANHTAWAYAHYLVPVHQNGAVPSCVT